MDINSLPPAQKSLFIRWRWSVYCSMFIGWSCYILVRKNLPSTMASLIEHQGFSRDDIGKLTSCFSVTYGFSKFLGSLLSDHASPRKLFSFGLIMTGLCALVFPLASNIMIACAVWLVMGIVQGCGWPPCVVLLKAWYPSTHIGRWWSILSCAGSVASATLPLLVIFITSLSNWCMSYYLFGALTLCVGITIPFSIKDSPQDIGIPLSYDSPSKQNGEKEASGHGAVGNWYSVFFVRNLWVVSSIYAIFYFVDISILNWSQLYFIQEAGMSKTAAAACYSFFQLGALTGNLVSGYLSDFLITPRTTKCPCPRAPFLLGVSIILTILLHLFRTTVTTGAPETWVSGLAFMLGVVLYSGISVVGLTAMEVVPKEMVSSAHGLACAIAQVGAFGAGWPFSHILETHDWSTAYYAVEVFLVVMVFLCLYLLFVLVRGLNKLKSD